MPVTNEGLFRDSLLKMETILVVTGILLRGGSSGGDIFVSGREYSSCSLFTLPALASDETRGNEFVTQWFGIASHSGMRNVAQRCAFPVDGLVGWGKLGEGILTKKGD